MTISLKNGEMRFYVNDFDLGSTIKINMINKKEMYLFVHCRNEKSRAEIIYISEIFNWSRYILIIVNESINQLLFGLYPKLMKINY